MSPQHTAASEGSVLLNMDEPTRSAMRARRVYLQKSLDEKLRAACTPPTDGKLEEFEKALKDPDWEELTRLVDQMKGWDVVMTIPEPKSFLYHTRMHLLLGEMLADIGTYERYLKLFIKRFGAENELILLKQPVPAGQENQDNRKQHSSGKIDAPIHFAATQLHEEFLEWLLGCETVNVNLRNSHKETALAILCEKYDEYLRPNRGNASNAADVGAKLVRIRALIKRLLAAGADFNICSMKLKLPIELLLRHGVTADDETKRFVEECVQETGYALVVVKTEGTRRLVGFLNNNQNVRLTEELFEIFLRYSDVEKFNEYWTRFTVTETNVKNVIKLLLHTTLDQKLPDCLRKVVDKGGPLIFRLAQKPPAKGARNACPAVEQRSSEMVYRVELKGLLRKACEMADLSVLQLLVMKITDLILLNDDPLLALTLTKAFKTKRNSEERTALLACAEFLADTQTIYMSKVDDSGNTPLHLALKYGFESVALLLLKQRYAYLGLRNRDNLTPLDYGTYEFWKGYLDQCIEVEAVRGNDRRMVRFNLNCFEPFAHGKATQSGAHRGGGKARSWKFVLNASSAINQPRRYERTVTEMTTVRQIAQSKELKPLLIHPVVHTFIMLKWMRLSHWNSLNLALTVLMAVSFGTFSLTACSRNGPHQAWLWLSVVATVLLAIREVLQMLFLRKSYASFENMLDILNVAAMSFVLLHGCHGLISSLVVISLAMQVTFLLGSLPFNSLSTMMYMFKTVSKNFLKSFLLFIPLIGSFIYAFFLTYGESPDEVAERDACTADDCAEKNFNSFHTFWNATIKTLVMTTGELEASAFDFADGKVVVFLLFLFIAPIVIMNLINGLAVSDIAAIREESELISVVKKVMLLEQYERGVANVRPAFLHSLFPRPFFAEHNSWIQVRVKEFRKIEVHKKEQPTATAKPMGNVRRQENAKFVPMSMFPYCSDSSSNMLLNFRVFKFSMFMRLDQSILNEAFAIHEKRQPLSRSGVPASQTDPSQRTQRTPSPPVTPTNPKQIGLPVPAQTELLQKQLKELKGQMTTLLELVSGKPMRPSKQHVKAKGLKRKARKRARLVLKRTLADYHRGDQ